MTRQFGRFDPLGSARVMVLLAVLLAACSTGTVVLLPEKDAHHTAVVVQQSPGEHGSNLVSSRAQHAFAIPYALYGTPAPFTPLAPNKLFDVDTGYRQLQATIVRFVADGFAGKVPNVTGFKPPVRDFDGDGATDDVDRDPSDPTVQ